MERFSLNGKWEMSAAEEESWHEAAVPGSMYADLISCGIIDDPYKYENEESALELSGQDYYYRRKFDYSFGVVTEETAFFLVCDGIDTLADIYINGVFIAHVENMHTGYRFVVTDTLINGENEIIIKFQSPLRYVRNKNTRKPLWGMDEQTAIQGFPHIRKTHCQFGWDWGPKLPDMGIWRDIYIERTEGGRIEDVYIRQENSVGFSHLTINIKNDLSIPATLEYVLINPAGREILRSSDVALESLVLTIDIENPELWWPNGYGEQPLYTIELLLKNGETTLYERSHRIGLRIIDIVRRPDHWGESFVFAVNGREIFMKGANYIPEDAIFGHRSKERTKALLSDCALSNYNCIRIWGGGHYGDDWFYDYCDELGLIVWQDFLFACSAYDLTENMEKNLREEFAYNIRRLRNHPSLGIWCGNNEVESAWADWGVTENTKLKSDYLKIFENIIPSILENEDPDRYYWPSSPSSGGGFVDPSSESRGDTHYWDVWHGKRPFEDIEKKYFRFFSEFGFEAIPDKRTLLTVIEPDQMNITSPQIESHQKCVDGNLTLVHYMLRYYNYPADFDRIIYLTQCLQSDYLDMTVRHLRSHRSRCFGSIYWQVNDTWPTISWSTIDHNGRWKGAQYAIRRAYAPLISYAEFDEYEDHALIYVSSEFLDSREITVFAQWIDNSENSPIMIDENSHTFTLSALSSKDALRIAIPEKGLFTAGRRSIYLHYGVKFSEEIIDSGNRLLCHPKHFAFHDPMLEASLGQDKDGIFVDVTAKSFARRVALNFTETDVLLSDNYFDLNAKETKRIRIFRTECYDPAKLQNELSLQSNYYNL